MTPPEDAVEMLLIADEPDRFRVYLDRRAELVVEVRDREVLGVPGVQGFLAKIKISAAVPLRHLSREHLVAWRRMLGECCVLALRGQVEEALTTYQQAERYIVTRATEKARFCYLQAIGVVLGILLTITSCAAYYAKSLAEEFQKDSLAVLRTPPLQSPSQRTLAPENSEGLSTPQSSNRAEPPNVVEGMSLYAVQIFLLAGAAGAFGSALSMMLRLNRLAVDPTAGNWAHYGEVVFRLVFGTMAACILIAAIKADLVLGIARSTQGRIDPYGEFWLLVTFGAVAGASEFLVPNFLQQLEAGISGGGSKKDQGSTDAASTSEAKV